MPQRDNFDILPTTSIGELLEQFPQLEEQLIGMAPAFKKLKNPILRKSIGKVASLRQAAAVAGVPVNEIVNKLRAAVGQGPLAEAGEDSAAAYFTEQPEWFDSAKIAVSLEECSGDPDKMPIAAVLQHVHGMQVGDILELVTDFLPAPGIDVMRKKGLRTWTVKRESGLIYTYVIK